MKKSVLTVSFFAASFCALQALDYICETASPEPGYEVKMSTCVWTSSWDHPEKPLPGKPGPNDLFAVRNRGYTMDIDGNLTCKAFELGEGSKAFAVGRTIKVKGSLGMFIARDEGYMKPTILDLEKCKIEIGSSCIFKTWKYAKNFRRSGLKLSDTSMLIKGGIFFMHDAMNVKNNTFAGPDFNMIGSTQLNIMGSVVLDSILSAEGEKWSLKLSFADKDGKLPNVFFKEKVDLSGTDFYVEASHSIPKGKYVLVNLAHKSASLGKSSRFFVNSQKLELGETVSVGDRTISLIKGAATNKDKVENDLILTVL